MKEEFSIPDNRIKKLSCIKNYSLREKIMDKTLQDELIKATILYRLGECKESIPTSNRGTRFEAIDSELLDLYSKAYINITSDEKYYCIDKKGQEVMARLVGMYDQFLKFEVFSAVSIDKGLGDDIITDEGDVMDHCFDPRFKEGEYDLRPAMMSWAVESAKREGEEIESLNPKRIIFLTKLANKELSTTSPKFWQELKSGIVFNEIDSIFDSLRTWQSLGEDEEESFKVSQAIYTAGMLEARKREGSTCSGCGIPLAIFEANAAADNDSLDECPNPDCRASFISRAPDESEDEYECPSCSSTIKPGQNNCYGCGARVDFSLPAGSVTEEVVEETTTTTETVYEDDYYDPYWGYDPYVYGWYDPWYPAGNAVALGFVCGAILI